MTTLEAKEITVGYQKQIIIEGLSLELPVGKIIGLIGPNGSGKSTLLKTLARIMQPQKGVVNLNGFSIETIPTKEVAQQIALLAQNTEQNLELTVKELVSYGRFPYQKGLRQLDQKDQEAIDWALAATSLTKLADRSLQALSGGQRQRVWLAMALAQDTDILILDEPTTFLDPAHQLEILQLLQKINQKYQKTIVMSIHDLNLASRFSDILIGLKQGEIIASGTPQKVMTTENLARLFSIQAELTVDIKTEKPLLMNYELQVTDDED